MEAGTGLADKSFSSVELGEGVLRDWQLIKNQSSLERHRAKTLGGLPDRLAAKVAAYTCGLLMNRRLDDGVPEPQGGERPQEWARIRAVGEGVRRDVAGPAEQEGGQHAASVAARRAAAQVSRAWE